MKTIYQQQSRDVLNYDPKTTDAVIFHNGFPLFRLYFVIFHENFMVFAPIICDFQHRHRIGIDFSEILWFFHWNKNRQPFLICFSVFSIHFFHMETVYTIIKSR